ncbi:Hypothetical predicted protein [Podarcis lilfordi]|uniref:Uncharacterized protein n=1 Tax=Podarcis lilfordi TaxID=74358 RepID=A0AA35JRL3_9SAUR|nr:Hypothetical predicted protein [Podarcis lilfordi]
MLSIVGIVVTLVVCGDLFIMILEIIRAYSYMVRNALQRIVPNTEGAVMSETAQRGFSLKRFLGAKDPVDRRVERDKFRQEPRRRTGMDWL